MYIPTQHEFTCAQHASCAQKDSLGRYKHITTAHIAIAFAALLSVSRTGASAFLFAVACITYIAPVWLVSIHKYKRKIQGPWDEAIVYTE